MAWPLTPLTMYLPGSLPPIKAADLNAIQDAINRGYRGTYSYAGLVVDGSGGRDATPTPGGISASGPIVAGGPITPGGAVMGTSLPLPTPQQGAIYQDLRVVAGGFFGAQGQFLFGANIASVGRTAGIPAGSFAVNLLIGSAKSPVYTLIPVVTIYPQPPGYGQAAAIAPTTIRVDLFNAQGNLADFPFHLLVFGG